MASQKGQLYEKGVHHGDTEGAVAQKAGSSWLLIHCEGWQARRTHYALLTHIPFSIGCVHQQCALRAPPMTLSTNRFCHLLALLLHCI